jgi:hypothetical protein
MLTGFNRLSGEQSRRQDDEDDNGMLPTPHGDEEGGYSYHNAITLTNKRAGSTRNRED